MSANYSPYFPIWWPCAQYGTFFGIGGWNPSYILLIHDSSHTEVDFCCESIWIKSCFQTTCTLCIDCENRKNPDQIWMVFWCIILYVLILLVWSHAYTCPALIGQPAMLTNNMTAHLWQSSFCHHHLFSSYLTQTQASDEFLFSLVFAWLLSKN